ncbi:MAG: hypothetical protein D6675_05815 [Gemmatimonadetes bacterium]|nr:MAG: hypothetical protein D6675_05815 [Gemmatimonadota bacterium]
MSQELLRRIVLVFSPAFFGLIILQLIHIVDVIRRDKKTVPKKTVWLVWMAIPVLGGFVAGIYYWIVVRRFGPPAGKSTPAKSGKVTAKTPKKAKKKSATTPKNKKKSTADAPSKPVISKPVKPKSVTSPAASPAVSAKSATRSTPTANIASKPLKPAASPVAQPQPVSPPTAPATPPNQSQTGLKGYGDDRRNRIIENNAAQPPIDGRPRVHQADKVNVKPDGLLITDGLNRHHVKWNEIQIIIGAQSPVGIRDKLMMDMFVAGLVAPYRIFDDVILYQEFLDDVSFNIEDNFRAFTQWVLKHATAAVVEPETVDFANIPTKHFAHQFRKFQEFDEFVWKIRNQVFSQTEVSSAEPQPAVSAPEPPPTPAPPPAEEKFGVIIREITPGYEKHILQVIMHLYKCDVDRAKTFLKLPSIVGQNLSREQALKLTNELQKRGAVVQGVRMEQLKKLRKT